MHINLNDPLTLLSGRTKFSTTKDQTTTLPADKSHSFGNVLGEVSRSAKAVPVTDKQPGIPSMTGQILVEIQATPQAGQEIQAEEEEPESPPLPEMSANAKNRFDKLIADITAHPEWAESWLEMCVTDSQGSPLFTLSGHPPRYVESGEIYTPETQGTTPYRGEPGY